MNIIQTFLQHASESPTKTAIIEPSGVLSYAELAESVRRLSALLGDMGVRKGDKLIVLLENGPVFTTLLLAAADIGAVVAPLNTTQGSESVLRAVDHLGAKFIVAEGWAARRLVRAERLHDSVPLRQWLLVGDGPSGARTISETADFAVSDYHLAWRDVDSGASYILTMTSGSTGAPKPIELSQRTKLERAIRGAKDVYGLGVDDVIVVGSPMFHSLGTRLALLPLLIGGTSVIARQFSADAWIDLVERHRVTFTIMVASQLERLIERLETRVADLSSLRTLVSSSALLRTDVKQRCLKLIPCELHECYGTSEVGIATNLPPDDWRSNPASVGKALPHVDIAIFADDGTPLQSGERGEIGCRTATKFSGYYNNMDATRSAFYGEYFRTGDVGYLDEAGFLYLVGRKKNIINVGGAKVYAEDVESVIRRCPGVRDCAVIGVADAYFGEAVVAVLEADPEEVSLHEIRRACSKELADVQQPVAYEFMSTLPRTPLGKIKRQDILDTFAGYDATATLRRLLG